MPRAHAALRSIPLLVTLAAGGFVLAYGLGSRGLLTPPPTRDMFSLVVLAIAFGAVLLLFGFAVVRKTLEGD